ncbi:hypothetical protein R0P29_001263 [Escherichia coli O83]|nr:hypothetical protein [Escherichia coli O83]ELP2963953.1 hypothetical protein [Escherichia coli O83]
MAKFIIIKVMRGTFPNDEKAYGPFAGKPGAIFHVENEEGKAKYIPVSEPPFEVAHLEEPNRIKAFVYLSLMMGNVLDNPVDLENGEQVAEFRMTPNEDGNAEIERL